MVTPILAPDNITRWKIKVMCLEKKAALEEEFDAVIVCNGHYSDPFIPDIPGIQTFPGTVLHSREYRVPEVFAGKTVVCVGGMYSGQDIAIQVSDVAAQTYLSHKMKHLSALPETIKQITIIKEISESTITLTDDQVLQDIDVIIFCTGYRHNFNFIDEVCRPNIGRPNQTTPLYQHIIHVDYPSLYFIGLPEITAITACITVQSQFVVAVLLGRVKLPKNGEMHKHIDNMLLSQKHVESFSGMAFRPMYMLQSQWKYFDELIELGGFQPLPKYIEKIFNRTMILMKNDMIAFRRVNFIIVNYREFQEIHPSRVD